MTINTSDLASGGGVEPVLETRTINGKTLDTDIVIEVADVPELKASLDKAYIFALAGL